MAHGEMDSRTHWIQNNINRGHREQQAKCACGSPLIKALLVDRGEANRSRVRKREEGREIVFILWFLNYQVQLDLHWTSLSHSLDGLLLPFHSAAEMVLSWRGKGTKAV